jgi:hypothetical protein
MLLASVLPLVRFNNDNNNLVVFEAMGIFNWHGTMTDSTWGLMAIGAIASILALITIFLYKGRLLQIRLTILNTLFIVGFYLFAGFIFFRIMTTQAQVEYFESALVPGFGFAAFMPLLAIVMNILAVRRIYADEALVRSLSRLR